MDIKCTKIVMVEGAPILLHKMVTVEEKKLIDTEEMVKPDLVRENIEQDILQAVKLQNYIVVKFGRDANIVKLENEDNEEKELRHK